MKDLKNNFEKIASRIIESESFFVRKKSRHCILFWLLHETIQERQDMLDLMSSDKVSL